jgi:hypothetical protein
MRLAIGAGVTPRRYAVGVAAALRWLEIAPAHAAAYLAEVWQPLAPSTDEQRVVLDHIVPACQWLETWERQSYPDLV